jgi:hypothetical protein
VKEEHLISAEGLIPDAGPHDMISVESLAKSLKDFQEADQRAREIRAEEFEIVLPVGVFPDLKDVEGVRVTHSLACPEGTALVLCKGVLQRNFDKMMASMSTWSLDHWTGQNEDPPPKLGDITNA